MNILNFYRHKYKEYDSFFTSNYLKRENKIERKNSLLKTRWFIVKIFKCTITALKRKTCYIIIK